jgi:putative transposase
MKGGVGKFIEETIRSICEWKSVEIMELNVREDHVHAVVNIPPKLSISEVMGMLKGKTAIKLFKSYPALKSKPYWGNHFWSRGYCVSTVGLDENKIRRYVKYQEENERLEEDQRQEFGLF